jgi:hypothetical protein
MAAEMRRPGSATAAGPAAIGKRLGTGEPVAGRTESVEA